MPFETYVPRRGPGGTGPQPTVRILKNGDLSINRAAHEQWLRGANYVELLYDPRSKKVGLKPRKKPTKATYKLRSNPQGGDRRYVSGRQFLENYGVKTTKAKTLDAKWNDGEGLIEASVG